jgi:uncharacterized protein
MNEKIIQFIEKQRVATICCVDNEGKPYCFSCFYAFDNDKRLLYFKSSRTSSHAAFLENNPSVAGTIQPDKLNVLAIQGIQFTGTVYEANETTAADSKSVYHKKYPFALAMPGEVWIIEPTFIKMTDNSLGFGKKIVWEKEAVIGNVMM